MIIVNNFLYILFERVIWEKLIRCEIRGENMKYFIGYVWWYDNKVNCVNSFIIFCIIGNENIR